VLEIKSTYIFAGESLLSLKTSSSLVDWQQLQYYSIQTSFYHSYTTNSSSLNMPLSISNTATATEKREQIRAYIHENIEGYTVNNKPYSFLPNIYINEVATLENIEAVIENDPGLATIYFPPHSRQFLTNKIFKEGKKLFACAMYNGLSMYFVMKLANNADDARLPLPQTTTIEGALQGDLIKFLAFQSLFCAPILSDGEYDQEVPSISPLPLTKLDHSGFTSKGNPVYMANFHRGHLRSQFTKTLFLVAVYKSREDAEQETCWLRRHFGFKYGAASYFLCYT
jgi:hypothetical protein